MLKCTLAQKLAVSVRINRYIKLGSVSVNDPKETYLEEVLHILRLNLNTL